jgi:WW domain-containing oxidoreductase
MGNIEGSQRSNGFNWYSTAEEVAGSSNLEGKNILITGANSGIGKETARVLAKHGAYVIMACRDMKKAEEAQQEILSQHPEAKVDIMKLDLGSLQSVKDFSEEFLKRDLPLHVLLCNAGIMGIPYSETPEGFEIQFGTNHLGHFLLTKLLLPSLKKGAPSRVVVVSSTAHRFSSIMFDDINGKTWHKGKSGSYSKFKAYGQSKAANILFASELDRRMRTEGIPITANSLHPGAIKTNLGAHLQGFSKTFLDQCAKVVFKSIPQGAATSVYAAISPELEGIGGRYLSDSNLAVPARHAADPNVAKKLWDLSEELTRNFQIQHE